MGIDPYRDAAARTTETGNCPACHAALHYLAAEPTIECVCGARVSTAAATMAGAQLRAAAAARRERRIEQSKPLPRVLRVFVDFVSGLFPPRY